MEKGRVVLSIAGRDAGRLFLILSVEGDFALIADGKVRRLDMPKRKRLKHLKPAGPVLDITVLKTDRQVRRKLASCAADLTTLPPI
jgi:ribosomal protein L14E/L6E/L27E